MYNFGRMAEHLQNQNAQADGKPLIEFFLREAQGCENQEKKAKILHDIGDIYRTQMGDLKQAEDYYSKACALNPNSALHLQSLYQAKFKQGQFADALKILGSLTQVLEKDLQQVEDATNVKLGLFAAYMEAAQILFFKLREKEQSLKILEKILNIDPLYRPAQEHLDLLLREGGEWNKLAQFYVHWGNLATEPENKNILYFQACQIYVDFLSDDKQAETLLSLVVKAQPQFLPALNLLKQIYEKRGEWAKLAQILEKMAQSVSSRPEKNQLRLESAHIWLVQVADVDQARTNFEQVVSEDPKNWEALDSLRKIYQTQQAFPDLIRILSLSLEATEDPQTLRSLRYALAVAYERGGNVDQAISHYQFILAENPLDWPTLRTLGVHFLSQGAWQKLVDLYELEFKKTSQPAVLLSIALRLSVLYERHLNQIPKAIEFIEKASELWPQNVLLLWELQRLYSHLEQWENLYAVLKKEHGLVAPSRQKIVLSHMATLCSEKLNRKDEAVALFLEVLKVDGTDLEAFRNLQDLYEVGEKWVEMTQILGQQIQHTEDPSSIVGLYLKAAEVFDQKLNQFESALFCYQKALELAPQHLPILQALGGLFHRRGEWQHLVDLYQQELSLFKDPREQSRIFFRMGEIWEKNLQDLPTAIQNYSQAVKLKPDETLFVEGLKSCFERQKDWTSWLNLMENVCAANPNPVFQSTQKVAMAHVVLEELKDEGAARQYLEQACALDPKCTESVLLLMDILRRGKDWQNLKVMTENVLAQSQEPSLKVVLLIELAELNEHQFQDRKAALKCWESVLKVEPRNMLALNQSERILRGDGNWESLLKVLTYRLNIALGRQAKKEAINIVEELAVISFFQLNDVEKTALFLQKIIEMDGSRVDIYPRLMPLLEQMQHWEKLTEVMRAYLASLPVAEYFREKRVEVWVELSQIFENRLNRLPDAVSALKEAQKIDPKNLFLFKSLERLFLGLRDLPSLGDLYENFAECIHVKEEKVRVLILAGEIFAGAVAQYDRAQNALERAVALDPSQTKAWEGLKTLYEKQDDPGKIVSVNQRILEIFRLQNRPAAECVALLVQNANLQETRLGVADEAIVSYGAALALQPKDSAIVKQLIRLYRNKNQWEDVLKTYAHWIENLEEPLEAVAPYFERGVVLQDHMKEVDYAVGHYEKALAIEPRHVASLERCSDIFFATKNWKKVRSYLDRWLGVDNDKARRVKALVLSGDVFQLGFKEDEKALAHFQEALVVEPAHEPALERLSAMYEAKGDWKNLVSVLERSISQMGSAESKDVLPLRMKLAFAFSNGLHDRDRAVNEYRDILKQDPTLIQAQIELAKVYAKNIETGNATAALKENRNVLHLDPLHFDTYRALAKIYEKLGQYDKIFCLYRLLEVFGVANTTEEGFLADNRLKMGKDFKAAMGDDDRGRYLYPEESKSAPRKFLMTFGPYLDRVFGNQFESLGFKKNDRLTPQSKNPIRDLCDRLAIGFGVTDYDLYAGKAGKEIVTVYFQDSPTIVVDADAIRRLNVEEQRFVLGKALFMVREGTGIIGRMKEGELKMLMGSLRKGFQAQANKAAASLNGKEEKLFNEVDKVVSRKARKTIVEFAEKMKADDEKFVDQEFRGGVEVAFARAGLVASCDFGVAMGALAKTEKALFGTDLKNPAKLNEKMKAVPFLKDLILFAASDEYFALRKKLGVALV